MSTIIQDKTIGIITQVIGPVVDVEFPGGELPEIYDALIIEDTSPAENSLIWLPKFNSFLGKTESDQLQCQVLMV